MTVQSGTPKRRKYMTNFLFHCRTSIGEASSVRTLGFRASTRWPGFAAGVAASAAAAAHRGASAARNLVSATMRA